MDYRYGQQIPKDNDITISMHNTYMHVPYPPLIPGLGCCAFWQAPSTLDWSQQ